MQNPQPKSQNPGIHCQTSNAKNWNPLTRQTANNAMSADNNNSSKTEFLLNGLKKQPAKIYNSSLNTIHSACKLGFVFDEHTTFWDQISFISKSCYYHTSQLCRICPSEIPKQPLPLPLPLFTLLQSPSHYYNLPKSQINHLQQIQNSL